MVSRLGRSRAALAVAALVIACGGRSVEDGPALGRAHELGVGGTSASEPPEEPATPPEPPVPPEDPREPETPPEPAPVACDELTVGVELAWVESAEEYGLEGPGMLSFSPDGARLATTGDQYDPAVVVFDAATGAQTWERLGDEVAYGRDAAWRFELRGRGSILRAVDLVGGGDALQWDLGHEIRGAALSGDGRFVGALACRDGMLIASRMKLDGDRALEVAVQPCEPFQMDHVLVMASGGSAALVGAGMSGAVTRVDFEGATVRVAALHALTYTTQSVFGIALSADGTMGLSAGTEGVRAWSHPELSPLFEPVPSAVGATFDFCYTERRFLSALSFSPDGHFLTTPGEGATLTVRRSCDLAPVATIERPREPSCSFKGGTPAGLAAFSPAGDLLAVWWGGVVGMYRLVP